MAKDKRTLLDCIAMATDLAEAMGSQFVEHPTDQKQQVPGLSYEKQDVGRFLLVKVGDQGRLSRPFGNLGMTYADFWQAGVLALKCIDLTKEEYAKQQEAERERVREEVSRRSLEAAKQQVYRPDYDEMTPEVLATSYPALQFHPRCSHDCQVKRNHHDLCDLCLSVNKAD